MCSWKWGGIGGVARLFMMAVDADEMEIVLGFNPRTRRSMGCGWDADGGCLERRWERPEVVELEEAVTVFVSTRQSKR